MSIRDYFLNNPEDSDSSSDSSLSSLSLESPTVITQRGSARGQTFLYTIKTYTADQPTGTVEDKSFTFAFSTPIRSNLQIAFSHIHPDDPRLINPRRVSSLYRARGGRNVKVAILKGFYKDQPGVIVETYVTAFQHRVLLADGNVITIKQGYLRLLDPNFWLPFGYPHIAGR